MTSLAQLQAELELIKERNNRVEADKAWETSTARKVVIAVLTYVVIALFMWVSGIAEPLKNALVPTAGFVLSTFSLPYFKEIWLKHFYKK